MIIDGATRTFTLEKGKENILEAGLRNGVELPYSCKGGVCSTCRCRLTEGEVDMDVNFALEDYEVARGFILSCQSYPVTDKVAVDFRRDRHGLSGARLPSTNVGKIQRKHQPTKEPTWRIPYSNVIARRSSARCRPSASAATGARIPESASPKVYGEGAAEAGKAAFDALLGKRFPLTQPATVGDVGGEKSPFGIAARHHVSEARHRRPVRRGRPRAGPMEEGRSRDVGGRVASRSSRASTRRAS